MTVLREAQLPQFLRSGIGTMRGALINGGDSAAVSDIARDIGAAFTRKHNGDVSKLRFEASELKSDPARLRDELESRSLFGGSKLIIVSGCDDALLKTVQPAFDGQDRTTFLLLEADALTKASKLKQAAEDSQNFACLTLYEADESELKLTARRRLTEAELGWIGEAEQVFFDLVGTARGVVGRELEKLILFCAGRKAITVEDVMSVCGDAAEFPPDEVIDAALAGDFETTERTLAALDASDIQGVLAQLQFHLQRLQAMRFDMQQGATADSAVKRAKPPVFFKRQRAVMQQLNAVDSSTLEDMVVATGATIATVRTKPALAEALTNRHFFWLAGQVRRRR